MPSPLHAVLSRKPAELLFDGVVPDAELGGELFVGQAGTEQLEDALAALASSRNVSGHRRARFYLL
jgi:hypothetical protein